jgi:hypothetical protein
LKGIKEIVNDEALRFPTTNFFKDKLRIIFLFVNLTTFRELSIPSHSSVVIGMSYIISNEKNIPAAYFESV